MKRMMIACLSGRRILGKDSFDRANGALGNAEIGGAWIANSQTFAIASNKAKGSTSGGVNVAVLLMPVLDCTASVDITWYTNEAIALVMRSPASGNDNFMRLRIANDGLSIFIDKKISGTATTVGSAYSYTWANGATHNLKMTCSGNNFSAYLDNTLIISATDDNATKTNYHVGLLAAKTGAVPATLFDNFLVTS